MTYEPELLEFITEEAPFVLENMNYEENADIAINADQQEETSVVSSKVPTYSAWREKMINISLLRRARVAFTFFTPK